MPTYESQRFTEKDIEDCIELFNNQISTKDVQDRLMEKYNIPRSKTSNFIKRIRKQMGIYRAIK